MTSDQFAYWLQGFAELHAAPPTEDQWAMIRDHLALVFNKVTPNYHAPNRYGSPIDYLKGPGCAVTPQLGARTIC